MVEKDIDIKENLKNADLVKKLDSELSNLGTEMERLFLGPSWARDPFIYNRETRLSRVNVRDKGDSFVLEAELPGIRKEDIDLEVTKDSVEICAEISRSEEREAEFYYVRENFNSSFYRKLRLPDEVLPEKAEASMDNGVLQLKMPKENPSEASRPHKVNIA